MAGGPVWLRHAAAVALGNIFLLDCSASPCALFWLHCQAAAMAAHHATPESVAQNTPRTLDLCAEAGIAIVTLPTVNLPV